MQRHAFCLGALDIRPCEVIHLVKPRMSSPGRSCGRNYLESFTVLLLLLFASHSKLTVTRFVCKIYLNVRHIHTCNREEKEFLVKANTHKVCATSR